MKAILKHLIEMLGHWLHGTTSAQFAQILSFVETADKAFSSGEDKLKWVKSQIAAMLESPSGKTFMGTLSAAAINWLIETAVGYLKKST